jgi:hypothetical protein
MVNIVFVWWKIIMSSWDTKVGQDLPANLKIILECILDTYKDIEHELETEQKYRLSYLKFVVSYLSDLHILQTI